MLRKKKIVVNIIFNTRINLQNSSLPRWIKYRIDIFFKFTLNSLINQTNQDFTVYVKYMDETERIIKRLLRHRPALPGNILFVKEKEAEAHLLKNLHEYDDLYIVRIDSDDLYHKSFIQQLHDYIPNKKTNALINQKGYLYDSIHHRMASIDRPSPPFYTLVYKAKKYIRGKRHPLLAGHGDVINLRHEIIQPRNYVVVIHGKNKSSKFKCKDPSLLIDSSSIPSILRDFM